MKTATYVSTSARVLSSDPYTGRIDFTFAPGLPTGNYQFEMIAASFMPGVGLTDAAGNAFAGYANRSAMGKAFNYRLDFSLQPTPTYITSYGAFTPDGRATGFIPSDVRATYEIPISGVTPRATAAPTLFTLDFSNTLLEGPGINYQNAVQLVRSANGPGQSPDGEFGNLGITNTSGFTLVPGVTVRVDNSVKGSVAGQYGYRNQLVISLPAGTTLSADYYRVYLPNPAPTRDQRHLRQPARRRVPRLQDATRDLRQPAPQRPGPRRRRRPARPHRATASPGGAFVDRFRGRAQRQHHLRPARCP